MDFFFAISGTKSSVIIIIILLNILLKGRIYVFHVVSLPLSPEYSGLCVKTSILSLVGQFGNFVFSVFTLHVAENILVW